MNCLASHVLVHVDVPRFGTGCVGELTKGWRRVIQVDHDRALDRQGHATRDARHRSRFLPAIRGRNKAGARLQLPVATARDQETQAACGRPVAYDERAAFLCDFDILTKMPEAFDQVAALALANVADQANAVGCAKNPAVVDYGIGQAPIPVVTRPQEVEELSARPEFDLGDRDRIPRERTCRHGLILAIDRHRVMRAGAAKFVAILRVRNVDRGPGIGEQPAAVNRHADAQRIGVAMAGAAYPLGPGIDDDLMRTGRVASEDVNATRREGTRANRGSRLLLDGFCGLMTEQPDRLFREFGRGSDTFPSVQSRTNRERIGHVLGLITTGMEHAAAIVVAKALSRPGLRKRPDYVEHFLKDG